MESTVTKAPSDVADEDSYSHMAVVRCIDRRKERAKFWFIVLRNRESSNRLSPTLNLLQNQSISCLFRV